MDLGTQDHLPSTHSCFSRILVMWIPAALLLLTAGTGQTATLEKPVLTVHPPWVTIFRGERVTLHCEGHHPLLLELRPVRTLWYRGHLLLPSHRTSLEVQAPGTYRCQTRGAPVSDPVHLSVSDDWLILQAPYVAVFEGDPLVLRCRARSDRPLQRLHFYHEGRAVRYFRAGANYTVTQARAGDSGHYQCSGTMRVPAETESVPLFSAKVVVRVQELFSTPVLRVTGRSPAGGLVLRCDTRPHPHKREVPLQFAFYQYSRALRPFHWAPEHVVPAPDAQELDSFWCEAATATRSVRKRSPWMQVSNAALPGDEMSTPTPAVRGTVKSPSKKPPRSRWTAVVPTVPSTISATGRTPMAGALACTPQGHPRALSTDLALLLQQMQELQAFLDRALKEMGATNHPELSETPQSLQTTHAVTTAGS